MILEAAQRGDSDTVIREMRVRSLMWPYYFVKVVLGYERLTQKLHGEEMERFILNLLKGHRRQGVEFPRAHYKTTCYTIGCGMWFVLPHTREDEQYAVDVLKIPLKQWRARMELHNQDYCQLMAFESSDNGSRKLGEIRRHFESNDLFRSCFPEIAYMNTSEENPWNNQAIRIRRTPNGFRIGEATFQVAGVGTAVQSQHYDIMWEDDIVGKDATEQPSVMASTIRWHGLLAGAMGGPNLGLKTFRFLVSNRWGYNDLNSHIRKSDPKFLFHTRSCLEFNETTGKEEYILYTAEEIEEMRVSMGLTRYDFACQYMNKPFLEGDREVDLEKVHRYAVGEGGKIICSCGYETYASHMTRWAHYDPFNAKGVRSTSSPAVAVVGLSTDNHVFLLDYFIARGDYGKIFSHIVSLNNTWWPEGWTYEDVGAQNMCEFYLRQLQRSDEFKAAKHRPFRRILPASTRGRAKDIRIRDSLFPVIENAKFACRNTQALFLEMLETWPAPVPDHDYDLLDALAQGPQFWRFPRGDADQKQEMITEDEILASIGQPYSYGPSRIQ